MNVTEYVIPLGKNVRKRHYHETDKRKVAERKGGQIFPLGVPSKGQGTLTGESPVMVKAGSHVAWMAGGDGNDVF